MLRPITRLVPPRISQSVSLGRNGVIPLGPLNRKIHLEALNEAQTQAVIASPAHPLQILAGPGTGKTKVLTSRIVHLIKHHGVRPESICAVTFTKRAAVEMEIRLHSILGADVASRLIVGTFHSVCLRYLRRYHREAGLLPIFRVIDPEDAFHLMRNLLRKHTSVTNVMSKSSPTPRAMLHRIGTIKMSGEPPINGTLEELIYHDYQKELSRSFRLDFEDLLVYTVHLFERYPELTHNIKHILIDEFQDTNKIQYKFAKQFTDSKRTITVVGDPDQSIYAWRSAVKENMENMFRDLPNCSQILLEQNYRSTGHIVAASDGIISQDAHRIDKHLWTENPRGKRVFTKQFNQTRDEHDFVAKEIARLKIAYGLEYSDFSILVRYNSQSRAIEDALKDYNIPCRVLSDERFYYRPRVRAVIAYLQLIDDETSESAFQHVFSVIKPISEPPAIEKIIILAESYSVSSMTYLRGPKTELTWQEQLFVTSFLRDLDKLRESARNGATINQLINPVLAVVRPENIWERSPDETSDWKNILELKTFAATFQRSRREERISEKKTGALCSGTLTPFLLRTYPDEVENDGEELTPEVVISTVHKAKGLEWPVVFIPSVENGVFPVGCLTREDWEEERRVFFVAATRAQALLFLTHSGPSRWSHKKSRCVPSPFLVEALENQGDLYTNQYPVITSESRIATHKLLRRDPPNAREIDENIALLNIPLAPTDDYYVNRNRPSVYTSRLSQQSLSPAPPLNPKTAQYKAKLVEFKSAKELITWFRLLRSV